MSLLLEMLIARCPEHTTVLDVAPTEGFAALLRRLSGDRYLSIDFDPEADGRVVDAQASITDLPIRSGTVGILHCSHVLEHVPDDARAFAELGRVLSPEGVALIQVPRRPDSPTDEDPSASVEDRIKRFGQADHVRYYGYDFEDRLRAAGLHVATFRYSWVLGGRALKIVGAAKDEEVWVVTTGVDPLAFVDGDAVFNSFARALINAEATQVMGADRLHELEARVEMAEAEAAEWKSHYEWLRSRPFVVFGTRASQAIKRLVPRRYGPGETWKVPSVWTPLRLTPRSDVAQLPWFPTRIWDPLYDHHRYQHLRLCVASPSDRPPVRQHLDQS